MLSELAIGEIKEFFSRVPLNIDGVAFRPKELFRLLWRRKSMIPVWWDVATDNILEDFLLEKGVDPAAFMRKVLWLNNQSTHMPGKVLLTWFYPRMESLFNSIDTRDVGIQLITLFNENWIPDVIHRRIKKVEAEGRVVSTMAFVLDPTFAEIVDWDMEFIGGPQMVAAPVIIGLPPFEGCRMLADTRPPERIIRASEDMPARVGGEIFIQGQAVGREVGFLEHCSSNDFPVGKFNPPDMKVVEIFRDYHCPLRKRVVLHSGCVYGAPLYLHTLEHKKLVTAARGALTNLVSDLAREELDEEDELEHKHQALLSSLHEHASFRYHEADESMDLNGEHLVKGIPAKLLHRILAANTQEGRSEFSYREFKRDEGISLGQKNSNFEVRFYRLAEKLKERTGALNLEKTGRGSFRLNLEGSMDLEEA